MARPASIGCLFTIFRHLSLSCICCIPCEATFYSACILFPWSVIRERNLTPAFYFLNNIPLNHRLLQRHLFSVNKIYTSNIFCCLHLQHLTYWFRNPLLHHLIPNSHKYFALSKISRIVFHPYSSCLAP